MDLSFLVLLFVLWLAANKRLQTYLALAWDTFKASNGASGTW